MKLRSVLPKELLIFFLLLITAGWVTQAYPPANNYGDDDEDYNYDSEGWHSCHDGTPLGWDTNNFSIWRNITRIH